MNSRRQQILLLLRILSDVSMVSLAWVLAFWLRFYTGLDTPKGLPTLGLYLKLIPFIIVIWFIVFSINGFYRRTGKHRSAFMEAIDILQSSILASFVFLGFTYFYEEYRYSRMVLLFFIAIHPFLIIFGRSIIRKGLRYFRSRAAPRSVVLIGSGDVFEQCTNLSDLTDVTTRPILSAVLVGPESLLEKASAYCKDHRIPTHAVPSDWTEFFSKLQTQMVMIALPYSSYGFLDTHMESIVNQVPDVRIVPDLAKYTKFASGIEVLRGVPVISVHESPLAGRGVVWKRLLDLFGASVALLLFAPVMLILGILIKLSSKGPVFYKQDRMGIDGNVFKMLKFRSMPINAEQKTGAVWAKPNDNRATWIGSFLRKSSLDELPQIFNVLLGEMSLVGPRPERPIFVEQFRKKIPGYMLRHKVKAGMTGWAQVNGWRGDTSLEKRIECDLYYIQNWSLWFDLWIITLTFLRGFFNKNAY